MEPHAARVAHPSRKLSAVRYLACVVCVALAGCGSSRATTVNHAAGEQTAYQQAMAERTVEGCRAYLDAHPEGKHRLEVSDLRLVLCRESRNAALKADTDAAYAAHVKRFPDDRETVEVIRRNETRKKKVAAADRAAYEKARRERTMAACRAYLRGHHSRTYHVEVKAIIAGIRESSLEAALRAGTPRAYAKHLRSFPADKKRVAERRAAQSRTRMEAVGRSRTARLVFAYTENGEPAAFPRPLVLALWELLKRAGIRVVDERSPDLVVTVSGDGYVRSQRYSRGYKMKDAIEGFSGTLAVRHVGGYKSEQKLKARVSHAASTLIVPENPKKRLPGTAIASQGIYHARCVDALARFVHRALGAEALAKSLAADSADLQEAAVRVLGGPPKTGKQEQVAAVRPYLRHADVYVRRRAVRALEQYLPAPVRADDPERLSFYLFRRWGKGAVIPARGFTAGSIEALRDALYMTITQEEIDAAQPLGGFFIPGGYDLWPPERAAMALATLGQPGLDVLMESLRRKQRPFHVSKAIVRMGDPARKALLALADDPGLRGLALDILGVMRAPEALERLNSKSSAEKPRNKRIREQLELTALLQRLTHEQSTVRAYAVRDLIGMRDAELFEPLMKALQDPESYGRSGAAEALGWFGDRRALPALRKLATRRNEPYLHRAVLRIEAFGE